MGRATGPLCCYRRQLSSVIAFASSAGAASSPSAANAVPQSGLKAFLRCAASLAFAFRRRQRRGKTRFPIGSLSRNWVTFIAVTAVNNSEDLEPTPLVSNIPCC